SPVMAAAAGPVSPDPSLSGLIANMSSAGYDFTSESSHRYESTVQSDDFLNINSTQKQALADKGFTLTATDTVVSQQDATYYTFTNSTTRTQVYVMGVQRIDAGGNPAGNREYSISPEFNPDGSAVASASAQGMVRAASSHSSCWWLWIAMVVVGLAMIAIIAALIFYSGGTYTLVALAAVAPIFGLLAHHVFMGPIGLSGQNYAPSPYALAWADKMEAAQAADILFSASMVVSLAAALLLVCVLFLYILYELGVCMGWWERAFWLNHDWDHEAGDFGLEDNGKPLELYKNDRILLSLFADTKVDKDAKWTIVSQGNLVVRQEADAKTENGTFYSWIIEAAELGSQNLALKYNTKKPVPPTVGITDYTLPVTIKEIPWAITTVDNAVTPIEGEPLHSESQSVSLAIDPSGTPHISYFDYKSQRIMYATLTSGAWTTKKVTDAVGYGSVSLALDPDGHPAIGYGGYHLNMGLEYAHWKGSAWSSEKVADGVGWGKIGEAGTGYFSSLAIDQKGTPYIVYNNGRKGDSASLMYATKNGTVWTNTVISQK